jgi:hypothetical protein
MDIKMKKMYIYLFIVCLVLLPGCGGKSNKIVNKESTKQLVPLAITNDTLYFSFRNDSILQNVKLRFLSDKQIYFRITSGDLKKKKQFYLEGQTIKIESPPGTSDTGEEDGFAYFVDDFEVSLEDYSGLIFIEQKNFNRLTFYLDSKDGKGKLVSIGVLKRLQ